jgi:hypothetical protein
MPVDGGSGFAAESAIAYESPADAPRRVTARRRTRSPR